MPKILKYLAVFFLTIYSLAVKSQTNWVENFTDSNYTINPLWLGDTANFIVNSQKQLQLNAPAVTGSSSLFTSSKTAVNASWEFLITLAFNPSTSNYAQVFLMSSSSSLNGLLNGYYLQFGGNTNDKVWLYKRIGSQNTVVAASADGLVNRSTVHLKMKVVRDNQHNWMLFSDTLGGSNFALLASGIDSSITSSTFFGMNCIYTSTRADKFFLDDIKVNGQVIVDTKKPKITASAVADLDKIVLTFSEALDSTSAANVLNYKLNAQNNALYIVNWLPSVPNQVEVVCLNPFQNQATFSLNVEEIEDLFGNDMRDTILYFTVNRPSYRSVVFNEIMADPTPIVGLPDAEFLELYNTTSATVFLHNWRLVNDGDTIKIGDYYLPAGGYVLLINTAISGYDSLPNIKIAAGSGWLKNDGEQLILLDENKQIIDAFWYSSVFYDNTAKRDGGWSLEQINSNLACAENTNWCSSAAKYGGTPALKNMPERSEESQNTGFKFAIWQDAFRVVLSFTHALLPKQLPKISATVLIDTLLFSALNPNQLEVIFTQTIGQQNVTLFIENGLSCLGNVLADTLSFSAPSSAITDEIVLNEILFNPSSSGTDFIEIWNTSNKTFLLNDLRLANLDELGEVKSAFEISSNAIILLPKHFLVFSADEDKVWSNYNCSSAKHFLNVANMPSMPDNAGNIALVKTDFTILESVIYSETWHHPLVSNPKGVSLERIHPSLKSTEQSSWHSAASSVNFATPGKLNSQFSGAAGSTGSISINTTTISPNNDGLHDVLFISYNLPPESVLSLSVFGINGVRIATIADNIITETEGRILWNGTDENGLIPATGIYILMADWFTPSGEKGMQKLNIVVSR